jgi:hypothetical protein
MRASTFDPQAWLADVVELGRQVAHDLSPAPMEGRLPGYQGMMQKLTSKLLNMQVHNVAAGNRLKDLLDD